MKTWPQRAKEALRTLPSIVSSKAALERELRSMIDGDGVIAAWVAHAAVGQVLPLWAARPAGVVHLNQAPPEEQFALAGRVEPGRPETLERVHATNYRVARPSLCDLEGHHPWAVAHDLVEDSSTPSASSP